MKLDLTDKPAGKQTPKLVIEQRHNVLPRLPGSFIIPLLANTSKTDVESGGQ